MSRDTIKQTTIEAVKRAGFDVYLHSPEASWLIYTDGTRLAYLQNERFGGMSITTKHKPSSYHGTGFVMLESLDDNDLTREILEQGFAIAPHWATHKSEVRKYRDFAEFLNEGPFNRRYTKV